jgi:hypothetical protein
MAYRNRRRAYGYKRKRPFSRYGRPRGGGRPYHYTAREDPADLTVAVGSRRIWVFNNTDREIVIPPGAYIELRIVSEGEGRVGYRYRAVLLNGGETAPGEVREERPGPEERLEDWV